MLSPDISSGADRAVRCYFFFLSGVSSNREHFVFAHDQVLLAIELDFLTRVLAEQDEVAGLDIERRARAVILDFAIAGGNHFALLRLFLGGVGDDDPADLLFAFLDALNNDAVMQRSDVHTLCSVCRGRGWSLPEDQNRKGCPERLALVQSDC